MTLRELAALLGAELRGDPDKVVYKVATLANAEPHDLSFLSNRRYRPLLANTQAGAVLVEAEFVAECPVDALVCADAYLSYARAAQALNPPNAHTPGVHPMASVHPESSVDDSSQVCAGAVVEAGARIAKDAYIGPNSVVARHATVGASTILWANVTLCHGVNIGARCLLHPGVVIGADGFGIALGESGWVKVPQTGTVRVGDDVEIGANTTIDRGALDDTVVGNGVKLDNLIQIGHNVQIGEHTAVAACVAIGGSAKIGARCTIAGAAAIAGHLSICDDVHLTATSAVPSSIQDPGVYSSGMPIQENRSWRRNVIRMRQLDDMARRLKRLEKQMDRSAPTEEFEKD